MCNNIKESNNPCSGCGACFTICPVNAISYEMNNEGFYEASVSEEKCIKCGKCKKVCSKFNIYDNAIELKKGKLYAVQSNDMETVMSCTSGGVAYEIAKYGIENGYNICGVIYDYEKNKTKTILTDSFYDLKKIKGSKYIQSTTVEAFKQIVTECKKDKRKKFIIFGTPCQIAGIKRIIEIENIKNEIITIDLFCHGVPSYLVWKKYLKEFNIKQINNIEFRDKKYSWHDYYMKIDFDGKNYYNCADKDNFLKIFIDGVLLGKSCQKCKLRQQYCFSDIRLGDFWGKEYKKREDGISAVLILSDKGKKLLDKITNIKYLKEYNDNILKLKGDYPNNKYRNICFSYLNDDNKTLKDIIKIYRKDSSKKDKTKNAVKGILNLFPDNIRRNLKKKI